MSEPNLELKLNNEQAKLLVKVMSQNDPELSYADLGELAVLYDKLHDMLGLDTPPYYEDGPTESAKYVNYKWIGVKKWVDDPSKTWEQRFRALEKHHVEETSFLISEIKELAAKIDKKERTLRERRQ